MKTSPKGVRAVFVLTALLSTAGGTNITNNIGLDFTIDLVGLDALDAVRISELAYELGLFDSSMSVYALVEGQAANGDGRIGLRWSIVPEPSRVVLLIVGTAAALGWRRRR